MNEIIIKSAIDLVVILHLGFICFVIFGAFLIIKFPRLILLHIPALSWAVFLELYNRICPLTPLENHLRQLAGEKTYQTGFISHYILPVIYPEGLTPRIQFFLAVGLIIINLFLYIYIFKNRLKKLNH